jgi:hypothetical protein
MKLAYKLRKANRFSIWMSEVSFNHVKFPIAWKIANVHTVSQKDDNHSTKRIKVWLKPSILIWILFLGGTRRTWSILTQKDSTLNRLEPENWVNCWSNTHLWITLKRGWNGSHSWFRFVFWFIMVRWHIGSYQAYKK